MSSAAARLPVHLTERNRDDQRDRDKDRERGMKFKDIRYRVAGSQGRPIIGQISSSRDRASTLSQGNPRDVFPVVRLPVQGLWRRARC